jgi:hypothetical protein
MSDIRFIDSLKVGAYSIEQTNVNINNNVNNYVITATGDVDTFQGEPELQFDSLNLAIGGAPSGLSRLEIYHNDNIDNLMLIKNTNTNTGIQVSKEGIFQLLEFSSLPNAVVGGIVYSSNEFYIGIES